MTPRTPVSTFLAVLTAVLLASGAASAQTSRPDRDGAAGTSAPPRGILAGPEVKASERGSGQSFLERRRDRQRTNAGGARRWLRLVGELDLTDAQRKQVRAEVESLARQRRRFMREHGEELRALERQIRAARSAVEPVAREQFARVQELRGMAPRPDAAQERIWSMLTAEQRSAMRAALARPPSRPRPERRGSG